jgi:hypothetical protein
VVGACEERHQHVPSNTEKGFGSGWNQD